MIKIIDNFFNQKDLISVQNFALTKAYYTPTYFDNSTEKNKENYYGARWGLMHDKKLQNLFIKQAESKFKIKIKKLNRNSSIDQRNLNHFKPHTDHRAPAKINILIMISGPTAVTNGTVFYVGDEDNCSLDMHVGFRENRAILFPSDKIHSQHASKVPNLKRYTATLFVTDYEE
jgi:hypothetical protein|tara:strand:- start:39 stop:560 length:522 start_codon:yes stop_codon:yes gene_type:complete